MHNSFRTTIFVAVMFVLTGVLGVFAFPLSAQAQGALEPREKQGGEKFEFESDDEDEEEDEDDEERTNEGVEELVRDVFEDNEQMIQIAACESSFRQYDSDGDVLTNPRNRNVVGVFQLHEEYHEEPAEDLGFDIYEAEGNIRYAQHLYETEGIRPWGPSSLCWDEDNQNIEDLEGPITLKLVIGTRHDQVLRLQEILNENDFELSDEGPGSPGEETRFFGNKTKAAIQELQCEYDIVCEGSEYTTGYGMVGEETRKVINAFAHDIDVSPGILSPRSRDDMDVPEPPSKSTDTSEEENVNEMSSSEIRSLMETLQERVRELSAQIQ